MMLLPPKIYIDYKKEIKEVTHSFTPQVNYSIPIAIKL